MVTITYCHSCGYGPWANRAAAVLKERLGIETEMKDGPRGCFDVSVNGTVVLQRQVIGLPSEEEVFTAVSQALR